MSSEQLLSLLDGTLVTIELTAISAALAAVVAIVMGVSRLAPSALIRAVAGLYIELFRGTSALVQLFFFYFAFPFFGIYLSPMSAGVLVLGLNVGAYGAEVVRGAVQAVPREQREAATALGMGRLTTLRRVVLPQAILVILPSASTLVIDLLKLTSLVSLITLSDLTFEAQQIRLETGESFQVFGLVMVVYFVLALGIAASFRLLERRLRRSYGITAVS